MSGIVDRALHAGLVELLGGSTGEGVHCANSLPVSGTSDELVTHLVLSYRAAFDGLWSLSPGFLEWLTSGEKTVVVVWDGLPGSAPEGVPLDEHVTPFDWAAAVSLRADPAATSWRIVILDLATHGTAACRALPRFDLFRGGLTALLPRVSVVRRQGVGSCLQRILAPIARNQQFQRDLVVRFWTDAISRETQREDRHALSNIIGPMLLLPAMSTDGRIPAFCAANPQARAFLALLQALGIAPSEGSHTPGPPEVEHDTESTNAAPKDAQRDEALKAVLVDDMHRLGWSEVLAEALRPTGTLVGALGDPDELQALVRRYFETASGRASRNQGVVAGLPLDSPDLVLFLDLRLFSVERLEQERKFVEEIVQYARRIAQSGRPLKWPAIPEKELELIDSWRGAVSSDAHPGRIAALTLLPRLIALADPFLPIVLFSSTGSRDLLEPLKPYGSIITDFEKPRLWGADPTRVVEVARAGMARALARARQLLRARRLCAKLSAPPRVAKRERALDETDHLELYIDESGVSGKAGDVEIGERGTEKNRFVIAGLLVGYRHFDQVPDRSFSDLMTKMEKAGLRWWPEQAGGKHLKKSRPLGGGRRPLDSSVQQADAETARKFLEIVRAAEMPTIGVAMEYSAEVTPPKAAKASPPKCPASDFLNEGRADNRYRQILASLLDLVIYELLPELGAGSNATLSIFVATRARVAADYKTAEAMIVRLGDLYGFHIPDDGGRAIVFGEDALHGVLYEVLAGRPENACPVKIEHARGVRLCYPYKVRDKKGSGWIEKDTEPQWSGTRHQHYVADILAGPCRAKGSDVTKTPHEPWSSFFANGVFDTFDEETRALLDAGRACARGERVRGLLELCSTEALSRDFEEVSGAALLVRRLCAAIRNDLTGAEFLRLAEALSVPLTKGEH